MDPLADIISKWLSPLGWTGQAVLRLLLAAVLGALVGLERESRGREAGFRTNLLVCVGSALVMLISISFASFPWQRENAGYNVGVDPARIAYGVMVGIGFLGAGAIIRNGPTVRGLTTAAAIWCVAAIGLACGFGLYILACAASLIVLVALWFLDYVEDMLPKRRYRLLTVRCPWKAPQVKELIDRIEAAGVKIEDQSFRRAADLAEVDVELYLSYTDWRVYDRMIEQLHADGPCRLISSVRE